MEIVATVVQPPLAGRGRGARCFALVGCTLGLGSPSWQEQEEKAAYEGSAHEENTGRLLPASCFE